MSEETLPTASPDPGTTQAQTPDTGSQPTGEEKAIPYERFKQVNDQLKELREWKTAQEAEAAKRTAEAKTAEEKRLAEQNEYATLAERFKAEAEELKPYQAEAERYAAALKSILETERKGLQKHILVLLDKMKPDEQLTYIAENKSVLSPAAVPDINGASKGSGRLGMGDTERRLLASELGVNPDHLPK